MGERARLPATPRGATYQAEILRHLHDRHHGRLYDGEVGVVERLWREMGQLSGEHRPSLAGSLSYLEDRGALLVEFGIRADGRRCRVSVQVVTEPPEGFTVYHGRLIHDRSEPPPPETATPEAVARWLLAMTTAAAEVPVFDLAAALHHNECLNEEVQEWMDLADDLDGQLSAVREVRPSAAPDPAVEARRASEVERMRAERERMRAERERMRARSAEHWRRLQARGRQLDDARQQIEELRAELTEARQVALVLDEALSTQRETAAHYCDQADTMADYMDQAYEAAESASVKLRKVATDQMNQATRWKDRYEKLMDALMQLLAKPTAASLAEFRELAVTMQINGYERVRPPRGLEEAVAGVQAVAQGIKDKKEEVTGGAPPG